MPNLKKGDANTYDGLIERIKSERNRFAEMPKCRVGGKMKTLRNETA